ncbi:MAG: glycosyltransferase family 4 protein [Sulfuriflexus sp.]|nr:glycosyltransferase family 4 protein [Sulfuriflexus sp.]
MKALVIISRDQDKASTRFRFVQYEELLAERGITLEYVRRDAIDADVLARIPSYDILINQKCLMKKSLARKVIAASKRIIFDMDDAIWTRPGRDHSWFTAWRVKSRLQLWLTAANVVTVANDYLGDYARQFSNKVEVIHMALDMEQWQPHEIQSGEIVTMGWAGSPVTVKNLEHIGDVLCECLAGNPQLRLAVYSGKRPELPCDFDYTPFAPGTEASFVKQLDIGLLPLPSDDAFTRGKSPIKALQYMASGVPVIGQVRGATAEILNDSNSLQVETENDWKSAIKNLFADAQKRQQLGKAGRDFVLRDHNMQRTVEQIVTAMSGVQG